MFNLLVQFGLEKQPQVRVLAYELLAQRRKNVPRKFSKMLTSCQTSL